MNTYIDEILTLDYNIYLKSKTIKSKYNQLFETFINYFNPNILCKKYVAVVEINCLEDKVEIPYFVISMPESNYIVLTPYNMFNYNETTEGYSLEYFKQITGLRNKNITADLIYKNFKKEYIKYSDNNKEHIPLLDLILKYYY